MTGFVRYELVTRAVTSGKSAAGLSESSCLLHESRTNIIVSSSLMTAQVA